MRSGIIGTVVAAVVRARRLYSGHSLRMHCSRREGVDAASARAWAMPGASGKDQNYLFLEDRSPGPTLKSHVESQKI